MEKWLDETRNPGSAAAELFAENEDSFNEGWIERTGDVENELRRRTVAKGEVTWNGDRWEGEWVIGNFSLGDMQGKRIRIILEEE